MTVPPFEWSRRQLRLLRAEIDRARRAVAEAREICQRAEAARDSGTRTRTTAGHNVAPIETTPGQPSMRQDQVPCPRCGPPSQVYDVQPSSAASAPNGCDCRPSPDAATGST